MDLVKRYIAAVQRELPDDKRDEIGRELKANIMDQLDALTEQQGHFHRSGNVSVFVGGDLVSGMDVGRTAGQQSFYAD